MWALFIVVLPPSLDDRSGMGQRMEPVLVQAFIPELTVEALDIGVLCGFAWLNQFQLYTMLISPLIESPTVNSGPWSVRIALG